MMGSHLDTQPTGGRYDGILGVNAGLEVLKVLHEHDVQTDSSIGVVNWTKYVMYTSLRPILCLFDPVPAKKELDSP
jgi:hypothetical protein